MGELNRKNIKSLHLLVAQEARMGVRMRRLAEALTGRPYSAHPLGGGPRQSEQLLIDLTAFDCVTWVESVLALARSRTFSQFQSELRCTRYRQGKVNWANRLHYFSDWMRENALRGAIKNRTRGQGAHGIDTMLGTLAGLPVRRRRLQVVPKSKLAQARRRIDEGAIVAFASVRARLDFFHTGLLFSHAADQQIWLSHASKSAGAVVAEPLPDFLSRNRMRGIAFATPLPPGDSQ